jgi:hypothetical protein
MRTANPRRAATEDRLAATHARLIAAVAELANGEAWRRMLETAARFPSYSANNVLLIAAQCPDATAVAGIRSWNALGRRVRAGEKGIAILAPCLHRPKAGVAISAENQYPAPPAAHGRHSADRSELGPAAARLRGFRVVHVFDLAQTEGEPLPEIRPQLLTGEAPRRLIEALAQRVEADGYTFSRGPCPGGANGITDFTARTVRVRHDVPDAQVAKTLAHELGHIRAQHDTRFLSEYRSSRGCRAQAEVEAESIAYLVTHSAGLASEGYSLPYLAGWSGGNTTVLRETAARVVDTARGIITDLNFIDTNPAYLDLADLGRADLHLLEPAAEPGTPWLPPARTPAVATSPSVDHDGPSAC